MRKRILLLAAMIGLVCSTLVAGPAYGSDETDDPGYGTSCDQTCINDWLASGDDGSGKAATTGIIQKACVMSGWAVGARASYVDSYTVVPRVGYVVNRLYLATLQSSYHTIYGTLVFDHYQIVWTNLSGQSKSVNRYTANSSVLTPSIYGGAKAGTMTVLAYWNGPGTFDAHCGPTHNV